MRFFLAAILAAAIALPFSASAQNSEGGEQPKIDVTRNGDWEVACQNVEQNGKAAKVCEMRQILVQKETQKEWLRIAVSYAAGNPKPVLRIFTPLGVLLPPGMQVQVDDAKPLQVAYSVCLARPARCMVAGPMENDLVAMLKKGNGGVITFVLPNQKKVNAPFSLKGFTKSFNSLPK